MNTQINPITQRMLDFADMIPGYGRRTLLADLSTVLFDMKYYTQEELAKKLSLSRQAISAWRKHGLSPSIQICAGGDKLTGTIRYSEADLQTFFQRERMKAEAKRKTKKGKDAEAETDADNIE